MAVFFAPRALLADGWHEDVLITTDASGQFAELTPNPLSLTCTRTPSSAPWPGWPKWQAIHKTASGPGAI